MVGLGYSAVLTPSGRLLRRWTHAEDRPTIFAAQFARSHACWMVTYPLAGWLMTAVAAVPALVVLAALSEAGTCAALQSSPASDPEVVKNRHENVPLDHPHLKGERQCSHTFVVDDDHFRWASRF